MMFEFLYFVAEALVGRIVVCPFCIVTFEALFDALNVLRVILSLRFLALRSHLCHAQALQFKDMVNC